MTARPTYDLLLNGGTLVDPSTGLDAKRNLAVTGQTISAILDPNDAVTARRVLDVSGLLVVPGFIDLHVHVFSGVSHYGIDVDPTCLARGVTTALDAGSIRIARKNSADRRIKTDAASPRRSTRALCCNETTMRSREGVA